MRVTATRSGDWWAIEAEHDGQPIFTQAKRLDQVEGLVRDAFATLDVDLANESIEVVPVIGLFAIQGVGGVRASVPG
jgi:hypothetical protein